MKIQSLKSPIFTLLLASFVPAAHSAVLAEWNTAGFLGTETSIPSSNIAPGITVTAITLGSGLGTTTGGGGMNTTGWTTDLDGAEGNYYGFTITVAADYELELENWEVTLRSSNTGPRDFALTSGEFTSSTFSTSGTSYVARTVDLSSLGVLTEGTYEFRAVLVTTTSSNGTGTVAPGGTHRIMNFGSTGSVTSDTPITLNGTVTLIPEPTTALLGGLGLLALLRRRR